MDSLIVRLIASDNLVSRNGARYPAAELPTLARLFVGCAASVDHPIFDGSVRDEWGVVVAAEVRRVPPPLELSSDNQAIVAAEGYHQLLLDVRCDPEVEHLPEFRKGLRRRSSISALYQDMRCPGCTCGKSVFSRECPNDFWSIPYYERCGVVDALEVSLVSVPGVRATDVVSINGEMI